MTDPHLTSPLTDSGAVDHEILRYKAVDGIDVAENPFDWWKLNERNYKVLANIARRMLCIPATSVRSERLFNIAGGNVDKKRLHFIPKMSIAFF